MTNSPEPWQLMIPFSNIVADTIEPVATGFGFIRSVLQPNLIRFERGNIYLDVSHHPHDGEVAIDFGHVRSGEQFSLVLFLRMVAPESEGAGGDGVSWTAEEVQRTLERLAIALRSHGTPILRGDAEAFDAMGSLRWWDVAPNRSDPAVRDQ